MKADEFKRHLAEAAALPTQPPCLPEDDVIVCYKDLPNHGIRYSRVHLRRLIARGLFPPPRLLSPNRQGWGLRTDLAPWKASRPAAPIKPEPGAPAEAA
jgi:hypothetical protein